MGNFVKSNYTRAYNKVTYKNISFRFNVKDEADLIAWLDNQDNLTDYIRRLIRADIKTSQRKHKWHMRTEAGYEHDDVKHYPYEVLEDLPYNDHYSIGYVKSMEDAADLVIKYCDEGGCPQGQIRIIERFVTGGELGTMIAGKQYHGY